MRMDGSTAYFAQRKRTRQRMDKVLAPARAFSHPKEKKGRIFEVDFLRGVAIVLMVILHFCYTFGYGPKDFYDINIGQEPEWYVPFARFCRFIFCSITSMYPFFSCVFKTALVTSANISKSPI